MSPSAIAGAVKPLAFVRRDFKTEASYRLSFISQTAGIFFSVVIFYFIARLFGEAASPRLSAYGGEYFPFVLIGIAFYRYLGVSLSTFSNMIREGQVTGTLEAMLVTPTRPEGLLVYSSLWSFMRATWEVFIYLLLGVFFFGVSLGEANLFAALVVLALTILSFSSFGVLSAAFVLAFKRGDPVTFLFGTLSALLGGVYYPITVLPDFLQACAAWLPLTYSLEAMRQAILRGATVAQLGPQLGMLSLFSVVGLPLGFFLFRKALDRAREEGTLSQF